MFEFLSCVVLHRRAQSLDHTAAVCQWDMDYWCASLRLWMK